MTRPSYWDGELESLRRFKDDVREVAENFECGVQVAKFADLKQGDVIEAYTSELVPAELQPALIAMAERCRGGTLRCGAGAF